MTASTLYNVGELEDLIRAKDADMAGETKAYAAFAPEWVAADSAAFIAWTDQWEALQKAYQAARDAADSEISSAKLGYVLDDMMDPTWYRNADATAEYNGILLALNPGYTALTVAPGSFGDLDKRIKAAANAQAIALPTWTVPQPSNPTSGLDPKSWQGYATGLAGKVGLVPANEIPPGTPGTPDGPSLWPAWLTVAGGAAVVVYLVKSVKDLLP